jgi:hypothetical protein
MKGFPLNANTALDYYLYLSNVAHGLGLAFGLKNNGDLLEQFPAQVLPASDFGIVENGIASNGESQYTSMISAGKPIFDTEYLDTSGGACSPTVTLSQKPAICASAVTYQWFVVFKTCGLGPEYTVC